MAVLKVVALLSFALLVNGVPGDDLAVGDDQLVSGSNIVPKASVTDIKAAASSNVKGDLKTSDSFGLGYYLPVVAPALVKYHYPLFYYHPYLHSIRHHGYGGYGFYQHGHGIIH